jgi:hypothetical protein
MKDGVLGDSATCPLDIASPPGVRWTLRAALAGGAAPR